LKIELALKDRRLSLNYKSLLQGAIYRALQQDHTLDSLHDKGFPSVDHRPFKLFVFSDIIGSSVIEAETKTMSFLSNGYFEVSAYDDDIIAAIARYYQTHPEVILASQNIPLINFEIIPDDLTHRVDKLICKTIAPVTVYLSDGLKTLYLKPDDPRFIASLHANILKKLASKDILLDCEQPFEILEFKRRSGHFRNIFFEAYDLTIAINKVPADYLRMIMNAGIGAKNSMGFGMVRIAA